MAPEARKAPRATPPIPFAFGPIVYFRDVNASVARKFSKKFKSQLTLFNFQYNKTVLNDGVGDITLLEAPGTDSVIIHVQAMSFGRTNSPFPKGQTLAHRIPTGPSPTASAATWPWASPNGPYLTRLDPRRSGHLQLRPPQREPPHPLPHSCRSSTSTAPPGSKLATAASKQGIFCVGGVCRVVPPSSGLSFSLTTSSVMRVLLLVGALLAYSPVFAQSPQKLEPVGLTTGTAQGTSCKVDVTFRLTETGGAEVLRYKAKCRLNRTDKADLKVEVSRIIAELDFFHGRMVGWIPSGPNLPTPHEHYAPVKHLLALPPRSVLAWTLRTRAATSSPSPSRITPIPWTPARSSAATPSSKPRAAVFIEDFTGHRCKNCPKASKAIKALDSLYGPNLDYPRRSPRRPFQLHRGHHGLPDRLHHRGR